MVKVTVWMSAYNHEDYISQCLDSVLSQKTNFEFNIVLGEDCSTDKTRSIVIDYKKKNPEKFKLYLPERNVGMINIDIETLKMCNGEYLALLNADDYWTDENKLQLQADLLDSMPDTVMCYHKAKVVDEINNVTWETEFTGEENILPVEKLFKGFNPIMTASVMCRNFKKLPEWYREVPYGDMPLYLILSESGEISYIDKVMCVYRIHNSGNWQGDSLYKNLEKDIKYYTLINKNFNYKYNDYIKKILARRFFDLVILNLRNNEMLVAKENFRKLLNCDNDFLSKNKKEILELFGFIYEHSEKENISKIINREIQWHVA